MKQLFLLLTVCLLSACDRFDNPNWQSYYQSIDMGVTGGEVDEQASNPFNGAFGDNFNYNIHHSTQYWGEDGRNANSHYTPYHVGSASQYYRGQQENGTYGSSDSYYK